MSSHPSKPSASPPPAPHRRHRQPLEGELVLSELDPDQVVDHLDGDFAPIDMATFGTVREVCPKCQHAHLRLVLRQATVRTAHLFCDNCARCFDAHYPDGAPALTI
ncbi:MAG: hypothetical protein V4508_21800 [Pseudomonadota bacterium]